MPRVAFVDISTPNPPNGVNRHYRIIPRSYDALNVSLYDYIYNVHTNHVQEDGVQIKQLVYVIHPYTFVVDVHRSDWD